MCGPAAGADDGQHGAALGGATALGGVNGRRLRAETDVHVAEQNWFRPAPLSSEGRRIGTYAP
jgi:hypothetical protein